jgi:hypothetical protein
VPEREHPSITNEHEEYVNNARSGDPRFYRLLDEIANLHARKAQDYSPASDPLKNFRSAAEFGVRPYAGVLTRLGDKWGRIATFAKSGQLQNESARDSHIDSAVYHLIAVLLLDDERPAPALTSGTLTVTAGEPAFYQVPVSVAGSDEPAGVYVESLDEPFPLPNFGPGSPAATTADGGKRCYVGEDVSAKVAHV